MESVVNSINGECEAYHQKGTRLRVLISNDRIASIEEQYVKGTGFRVFVEGHQGFAYTTDESSLKEAAELAWKLAKVSSEERIIPTPEKYPTVDNLSDPGLENMDVETIFELASAIIEGAAEKKGHTCYGSIEITDLYHEILTSYGIHGNFHETLCCAGVDVEVQDLFGTQTAYTRKYDSGIFEIGKRAAELAAASRDPQRIHGGRMSVILRPAAVSKLFEYTLVPSLLADSVDNKTSIFQGKIRERVASDITEIDNGIVKGGLGSRPFDGEGTPCKKTTVIESGFLTSFLYDTTLGAKYGTQSTGNAMRSSFRAAPTLYISNMMVEPGCKTDELIEDTRKGIVIHDIVGSFSFNPSTEKFGFEGKNSFLVENGEQRGAVCDVTVTGSIKEVLHSIVPGDDTKDEGLFRVPSVRMMASVFV